VLARGSVLTCVSVLTRVSVLGRESVLSPLIVFNQERVSSWCMRLRNACGAKAPRRVLIPAIDGSVPRRSCSPAPDTVRRRGARVMPARTVLPGCAGAAQTIAGIRAGSSLRPTISSLFRYPPRTATALGGTLLAKAAMHGRHLRSFPGV